LTSPLHLIIAEAGLELVPREIEKEPCIIADAMRKKKKPNEILLDISIHYKAMRRLDKWFKRGRPDIVHIAMLLALSSLLNIAGLLRLYIHTIGDKVIFVNPKTKIPRNYNRFVGLMEQLLLLGSTPPNSPKPLLWIENLSLKHLLEKIDCTVAILMHEKGSLLKPRDFGKLIAGKMMRNEVVCIAVGGFQHGDFEESTLKLFNSKISLYPAPLETWSVISMIINSIENSEDVSKVIWSSL
jgi:rRNA small subunit pseudouridine methyltransferase Nep1